MLDLPADLAAREVPRAGVRRTHTVVGMNVYVRVAARYRGDERGHRLARKRAYEVRRPNRSLRDDSIKPPGAQRAWRHGCRWEQPDDNRSVRTGGSAMDVRHERVVDIRDDELVGKLGAGRVEVEDGVAARLGGIHDPGRHDFFIRGERRSEIPAVRV